MIHPTALIPWLDPAAIIDAAGPWALVVVCAIIFAETGLLIGFLLPGDTLLIMAGILWEPGERPTDVRTDTIRAELAAEEAKRATATRPRRRGSPPKD